MKFGAIRRRVKLWIGNFSSAVLPDAIKASIGETGIPKYGKKFDGTNSKVRTYDAANLNWAPSTSSVARVDEFKNILPFKTKGVIRQYNSQQVGQEKH